MSQIVSHFNILLLPSTLILYRNRLIVQFICLLHGCQVARLFLFFLHISHIAVHHPLDDLILQFLLLDFVLFLLQLLIHFSPTVPSAKASPVPFSSVVAAVTFLMALAHHPLESLHFLAISLVRQA